MFDHAALRALAWILSMSAALLGVSAAAMILFEDALARAGLARWPRIGNEHSLADSYQQGLLFGTAVVMACAAQRHRSRMALALSVAFGFMWFDDAMMYHETLARLLAERFALPVLPGLREQDTGELIAWGAAGLALSVPLGWAALSGDRADRRIGLLFVPLAVALFFVGVVVDMVHIALPASMHRVVIVIEDGGELIVVAVALALAVAILRAEPAALRDPAGMQP